jgi:sugar phosphate isomerase/epimerase
MKPIAELAYCTNVHPGETLARTKSMLDQHAVRVRELVFGGSAPSGRTLGIGLWLSAQSARELLAEPEGIIRFRAWLEERGLAVRTINGFPYGDFHGETVKTRVYHPHWADPNRSLFTLDLAKILAALVEPGTRTASISTVPIGWRSDFTNEGCGASVGLAASQLEWVAERMREIEDRTGVRVTIDLEPEPGCLLDRAEHVVSLFDQCFSSEATRTYLGVCHDICHSAVMFEEQDEALELYARNAIRVGKMQVSAALACHGAPKELAELAQFDESRYMHQTCVLAGSGEVRFFEDLGLALDAMPDGFWRTHFHVPVHLDAISRLTTTAKEIPAALAAASKVDPPVFEVETYAWTVLPPHLRERDLAAGIAKELAWTRAALERAGYAIDDGDVVDGDSGDDKSASGGADEVRT